MFRLDVESGEAAPVGFSSDSAGVDFAGATVTGTLHLTIGGEPAATVAGVLDTTDPVRGGYVPFVAPTVTGTKVVKYRGLIQIVKAGEIWSPKVELLELRVAPR